MALPPDRQRRLRLSAAAAAPGGKRNDEDQHRIRIRELVDELLSSVSEEDRLLLTLKEVEGLSLKELEKVYKVNENALKVRLFRARQRVLKKFGQQEEEAASRKTRTAG